MTRADFQKLSTLGVPIVSDEVYAGLSPEPDESVLELAGEHYMVGSFSKLFACPGLRLGFLSVERGDCMSGLRCGSPGPRAESSFG